MLFVEIASHYLRGGCAERYDAILATFPVYRQHALVEQNPIRCEGA